MSLIEGQWMYNTSYDGVWSSGDYYDTKEEAIKFGTEEYSGHYDQIFVGQIAPLKLQYGIDTESILDRIAESVYDEVGEAAEDYLRNVKDEHFNLLEERMNKILNEWMHEFNYDPSFFKIINTETINLVSE